MKHFIYVALAISSVAMFAANVAGTALLRSESKKIIGGAKVARGGLCIIVG